MPQSTTFDRLKTWEPFAFPDEPGKRLIKTGKRTFRPDGSTGTPYDIDRMTRKVIRKPYGQNPGSRDPRGEFLNALYRFMEKYDISDLDLLEAVADITDDDDLEADIRMILKDQLGT